MNCVAVWIREEPTTMARVRSAAVHDAAAGMEAELGTCSLQHGDVGACRAALPSSEAPRRHRCWRFSARCGQSPAGQVSGRRHVSEEVQGTHVRNSCRSAQEALVIQAGRASDLHCSRRLRIHLPLAATLHAPIIRESQESLRNDSGGSSGGADCLHGGHHLNPAPAQGCDAEA